MCVSMAPAQFSGTILYMGETDHYKHGEIHVLGYQNTAINLHDGPNAMILHFPAAEPMGPNNILDTSRAPNILKDIVEAVRPRTRSASLGRVAKGCDSVMIFDHGIYTIVLAREARTETVMRALDQVDSSKRPAFNADLIDFYLKRMSRHILSLCCFNNRDARNSTPMLWWYKPSDPTLLQAPAIDCHTGAVPNLNDLVEVDHWVIAGSDHFPNVCMVHHSHIVHYQDHNIDNLRDFLPDRVVGQQFKGRMPNRDFAVKTEALRTGRNLHFLRALPLLD